MAAPIDFGFFDRPTVRGQKEAISLGTFGSLLGFAPGGKGTLSGFELQFLVFTCLKIVQNTVLASTIFSFDVCRQLKCRMNWRFHPAVEPNEVGLDCLSSFVT